MLVWWNNQILQEYFAHQIYVQGNNFLFSVPLNCDVVCYFVINKGCCFFLNTLTCIYLNLNIVVLKAKRSYDSANMPLFVSLLHYNIKCIFLDIYFWFGISGSQPFGSCIQRPSYLSGYVPLLLDVILMWHILIFKINLDYINIIKLNKLF